jgi:hypothetical protein
MKLTNSTKSTPKPSTLFRTPTGALRRTARSLLVALCLAAPVPLVAGCASENVRLINDPFLGPTRGFVLALDPGGFTGVSVKEAQSKYTMQVMVVEHGDSSAVAKVGDKTDFLVGSDILTLENTVEARPVANVVGTTVITQWQLTFKPDAQEAARLAAAPLNAVKVRVGGQEYQIAVVPTKAAKFQANMAIMTSGSAAAVAAATPPGTPAK